MTDQDVAKMLLDPPIEMSRSPRGYFDDYGVFRYDDESETTAKDLLDQRDD